jgi:ATP-dependent DNA helicase RecG
VRINVFADRIEIRSPGRLPNTLTLQSIRYRQFTRNQAIASFLSGAGFMEQRGKGILRLEKLSKEAGLTCIFFLTPDENEFVVTMGKGGVSSEQ